jgi:hypothetical protein
MNQFLFELYTLKNDDRVFLGYRKVLAASKEEAESIIREKEKNIILCQIHNPKYQ